MVTETPTLLLTAKMNHTGVDYQSENFARLGDVCVLKSKSVSDWWSVQVAFRSCGPCVPSLGRSVTAIRPDPCFFPHVTGSTGQRGFSGKKREVELNVPLCSEYRLKSFESMAERESLVCIYPAGFRGFTRCSVLWGFLSRARQWIRNSSPVRSPASCWSRRPPSSRSSTHRRRRWPRGATPPCRTQTSTPWDSGRATLHSACSPGRA